MFTDIVLNLRDRIWGEVKRNRGLPWWSVVKNMPANAGDTGLIPGSGRSAGVANGCYTSILAWKIPWTEEPGRLPSMGLQKSQHDLVTKQQQ